jgi:hypothetical protein
MVILVLSISSDANSVLGLRKSHGRVTPCFFLKSVHADIIVPNLPKIQFHSKPYLKQYFYVVRQ